ncbi:hypothetical protein [Leifsonia shinshuensis]|uniref:Divalent metal cation (Fe/Co/Zn/Cd) transporter n=1 Tax=Leifsonia shinshuensis TaxID=150026 RepID=A0A853CXF2_9MICO|nr:hypothetical protein [Leifsonia shinshuensis]NYJ23235.1 divalent metal cation (Fe/Co/Zn/Cd) transporter [Leifsonia shinshuensis]
MTTTRDHPLLGRDARLVVLITGVLAGAVVGFLHILDYELGSDTKRELLSPQLFLYGPAAAGVGFASAAAHYAWFARARPGAIHWWRHVGATATAFAVAYSGYTLLWLTTPATYLGWFSEPLGAVVVAVTVEYVVHRLIRERRNVERRPLRSTSQ